MMLARIANDAGTAMRAWSLEGRVVAGFALALAVLLAALFTVSRSTQRLILESRNVAATQEVLAELRTTRSLLQDTESALRDYILTAEPKALETYTAAARHVHPLMVRIAVLTAEELSQPDRLNLLETRIDEKLEWNDRPIAEL